MARTDFTILPEPRSDPDVFALARRIARLLNGLTFEEASAVIDLALQVADEPDEVPIWVTKHIGEHPQNLAADPDGIFYGRSVVFTGELTSLSMSRDQAARRVAELGGLPQMRVTLETDMLVVGDDPGEKLAKANDLATRGQVIEIINPGTFGRYANGATFASEGRDRSTPNAEIRSARDRTKDIPTAGLAIVTLTCRACGKTWERPAQRGRLPFLCPECRAEGRTA